MLEDLTSFRAALVVAGGRVAARDGVALPFDVPEVPEWVRGTMSPAPLSEDAFDLGAASGGERVRVIEIVPGQLITSAAEEDAPGRRFAAGGAVRVPRFGEGTVCASDARTVTIGFPKGRRRSFLAEYVEPVERVDQGDAEARCAG